VSEVPFDPGGEKTKIWSAARGVKRGIFSFIPPQQRAQKGDLFLHLQGPGSAFECFSRHRQ